MANNKAFKIKNGLLAGRYLGSNGTETAGTEGYSLSSASYDSVSFSVASQEAIPRGLFFKTDGTKMYVTGSNGQEVNEYNLSSAFDVSTATYNQVFSVSSQDTYPISLFFKSDGIKMYVLGNTNDAVYEYTLSTAWDISTSSYVQNFSVSSQNARPEGLFFKPDGTKMFVAGSDSTDHIYEYNLSTAFDLSTASYSQSFNTSSQTGGLVGVSFNTDGTQMFVLDDTGDDVNEYSLSTGWDVSTVSYVRNFSVSSQTVAPQDVYFTPDGTKMYVVETTADTIYQYSTASYTQSLDLSTGNTFSFTPSGATTVSFTNPPASGTAIGFTLEVINTGGYTLTWPSSIKWPSGTTPTATATKEVYTFITTDGGTTYYGKKAGENLA